jgi:hypothetical protein
MPELMKDPEFGKQMISLKADSYDMEGPRVREAAQLQGVLAARCSASADSLAATPQARRAPVERGQCFQNATSSARPSRRGRRSSQAHPKDPLAQKALYRWRRLHQLAYYTKAADLRGLRQQVPR